MEYFFVIFSSKPNDFFLAFVQYVLIPRSVIVKNYKTIFLFII